MQWQFRRSNLVVNPDNAISPRLAAKNGNFDDARPNNGL